MSIPAGGRGTKRCQRDGGVHARRRIDKPRPVGNNPSTQLSPRYYSSRGKIKSKGGRGPGQEPIGGAPSALRNADTTRHHSYVLCLDTCICLAKLAMGMSAGDMRLGLGMPAESEKP